MKLGLGTVQFGLDYGVSNRAGRVPGEEVGRMLVAAEHAGVRVLDTAHLYGDSEQAIGGALPAGAGLRVVTKTPRFGAAAITDVHADALEAAAKLSRERLGRDRLGGLLLHHAPDALAPGSERLFERMAALKQRGWVDKIGVSVYGPDELEPIVETHAIDLVQIPFNVLDQRLAQRPALLRKLGERGVEVHVRSAFLQGLLLMDPGGVGAYFAPWKGTLVEMRRRAEAAGLSPLALALRFALAAPFADAVIVGATSTAELGEIISAAELAKQLPGVADLASTDDALINPARWPPR